MNMYFFLPFSLPALYIQLFQAGFDKSTKLSPSVLQYPYILHGRPVIVRADLDAGPLVAGVDHLITADIERHMVDMSAAVGVEHKVSGLQFALADLGPLLCLSGGGAVQAHAVLFVHGHGKSGAVGSLGQAASSVHIGIA